MDSYLFHYNPDIRELKNTLAAAAQILPEFFTVDGDTLDVTVTTYPKLNAGWLALRSGKEPHSLLSEYDDDQLAVVAHGDYDMPDKTTTAAHMAKAYSSGGVTAVRRLDRCFNGIVLDKVNGRIHMVTDQMGLRSPFYATRAGKHWVSPQDLLILATGGSSLNLDQERIYSMIRIRWVLGGGSLMRGVDQVDPRKKYELTGGQIRTESDHLFEDVDRIDENDSQGKRALLEHMIDYCNSRISEFARDHELLLMDLTAGLDTRMNLALILNNCPDKKLIYRTHGDVSEADYKIATGLARHYGIPKLELNNKLAPEDVIRKNLDDTSILSSGQGTAWGALYQLDEETPRTWPHITGHNAGYVKGFYYPDKFATRSVQGESISPVDYIPKKITRWKAILTDAESEEKLKASLRHTASELAAISNDPFDILDMLFIYENMSYFGAYMSKLNYNETYYRFCIFEQPELLRLSIRMPSPIAQQFALHSAIIKRYAPYAFKKVVNNKYYMPWVQSGTLRLAFKKYFALRRRLIKRFDDPQKVSDSPGRLAAMHQLIDLTSSLTTGSQSLVSHLPYRKELVQKITNADPANLNMRSRLSFILTMENWYRLARAIRQKAIESRIPVEP